MLYYEQVFGNAFERKKNKCCGVLMKHRRKVKGGQVIILQMAQQLKKKILRLYQGNYFAVRVKVNFCQIQTYWINGQDKIQSITDTDNEFSKCQTSRKKFQLIDISPVSLHIFMKTLKTNISEAFKV